MSDLRTRPWRYHPARDQLLAEAHARPFTPLNAPMLATRIATLSGQEGAASDHAHMTALCRSLGRSEPGPDARWCVLDAGKWQSADPDRMTSYLLVMSRNDDQLGGRLALSLLEIETYRLMALLAFPLAGEATELLTRIEAEAGHLASQLSQTADADADRALLARLASLAGETEALSARTSFRFGAATAYHEIVLDRIETIQEIRIAGLQTLGEFMERRLASAMRTCDTMARRQQAAIERIARTKQMLNTRVEVATEATNVKLLESMDKRAKTQLRLQSAAEGFSVFAIAYYALSLASYPLKAIEKAVPGFDAMLAGGALAPILLIIAYTTLRRFRSRARDD